MGEESVVRHNTKLIPIDDTIYSQLADYYYDERICILRCVLQLLTYFQDERHPYMVSRVTLSTCDCKRQLSVHVRS